MHRFKRIAKVLNLRKAEGRNNYVQSRICHDTAATIPMAQHLVETHIDTFIARQTA